MTAYVTPSKQVGRHRHHAFAVMTPGMFDTDFQLLGCCWLRQPQDGGLTSEEDRLQPR